MLAATSTQRLTPTSALLAELYAKSQASRYGIGEAEFSEILTSIAAKYAANEGALADFYHALKLENLAIARACAKGNEKAWEVFLTRYRENLFDSARQITREEGSARELADSIYADLFGTSAKEGQRVSKLNSYTARGSLEGWLRTVLAQEWVNRYRKQKRVVSLDEELERGMQFASAKEEAPQQATAPVIVATDATLAALPAEDKYLLASYFLDKRTLADVARTLRVHESTVSRKMEKLVKNIRKQIVSRLQREGMSKRAAEEALEIDVRDFSLNVAGALKPEAKQTAISTGLSNDLVQDSSPKAFQAVEGKKDYE
jgi:RNA polymerase sigma-70 factor (ECF subfamily)